MRILTILAGVPGDSIAVEAFKGLASVLVSWWDAAEERNYPDRQDHSHDVETQLTDIVEKVLLQVSSDQAAGILAPILAAIDRHPRELSYILQGIIGIEDQSRHTDKFWAIWQLFANAVKGARWLVGIDREHSDGHPMMHAVFMTQYWKDETRHWASLEGHADLVHRFFEELAPSSQVLDDYVPSYITLASTRCQAHS